MKEQDYLIVDLGLPSGIKWADRNVGADTPQDNGLYFSWGNVDGHAVDKNGKTTDGYSFDKNTYATTLGCKYTGSTLDSEHDAATVNMGDDWRMPTVDETRELVENTDHYYIDLRCHMVSQSELYGSRLRSICFVKKGEAFDYANRSNFIEFPFAGRCNGSLLFGDGLCGRVWSSSVSGAELAHYLDFDSYGDIYCDCRNSRFSGQSVRGVTLNNKI